MVRDMNESVSYNKILLNKKSNYGSFLNVARKSNQNIKRQITSKSASDFSRPHVGSSCVSLGCIDKVKEVRLKQSADFPCGALICEQRTDNFESEIQIDQGAHQEHCHFRKFKHLLHRFHHGLLHVSFRNTDHRSLDVVKEENEVTEDIRGNTRTLYTGFCIGRCVR